MRRSSNFPYLMFHFNTFSTQIKYRQNEQRTEDFKMHELTRFFFFFWFQLFLFAIALVIINFVIFSLCFSVYVLRLKYDVYYKLNYSNILSHSYINNYSLTLCHVQCLYFYQVSFVYNKLNITLPAEVNIIEYNYFNTGSDMFKIHKTNKDS